jgi:flavodoxin
MKGLIVYDSVYGNTEKTALAIYEALGKGEDMAIFRVGEVKPEQFAGLDLLLIGSPTQRFRSMPAISNLLNGIPSNALKGIKVTAFDTRMTQKEINETPALAFFVSYLPLRLCCQTMGICSKRERAITLRKDSVEEWKVPVGASWNGE